MANKKRTEREEEKEREKFIFLVSRSRHKLINTTHRKSEKVSRDLSIIEPDTSQPR